MSQEKCMSVPVCAVVRAYAHAPRRAVVHKAQCRKNAWGRVPEEHQQQEHPTTTSSASASAVRHVSVRACACARACGCAASHAPRARNSNNCGLHRDVNGGSEDTPRVSSRCSRVVAVFVDLVEVEATAAGGSDALGPRSACRRGVRGGSDNRVQLWQCYRRSAGDRRWVSCRTSGVIFN